MFIKNKVFIRPWFYALINLDFLVEHKYILMFNRVKVNLIFKLINNLCISAKNYRSRKIFIVRFHPFFLRVGSLFCKSSKNRFIINQNFKFVYSSLRSFAIIINFEAANWLWLVKGYHNKIWLSLFLVLLLGVCSSMWPCEFKWS